MWPRQARRKNACAFCDETMKSDEMIADATKRALDINPRSGAELDRLFAQVGSPTPETVKHVARIMGIGG